eukprot:s4273_g6.t1
MSGSWQQEYGQQWEEQWQAPNTWGKGKYKKGQGQNKGKKGKGKWQQPAAEQKNAPAEWTGRILSRYQWQKAILKTAADPEGSAFVKESRKAIDDVSFLGTKNLKKVLSAHNSHLLRRPGIGLSEAAGSVQAGADVLGNIDAVNFAEVGAALEQKEVKEALQVLNTLDTNAEHSETLVAGALKALHAELCNKPELGEALVKVTVGASRLYLCGAHLLPLLTCLKNPEWWCEALPQAASDHKRVQAWRDSPHDKQKMFKALAAMVTEKIEAAAEYGKNDAAALFAKKRPARGAAGDESDSSESAAKTPKERSSSTGSSAAAKEKPKTPEKAPAKKKKKAESVSSDAVEAVAAPAAKKAKKEKEEAKHAKKEAAAAKKAAQEAQQEAKAAAMTGRAQADAQALLDLAETAKGGIGLDTGRCKKEELLGLVRQLPILVSPHFPALEKAAAKVVERDSDWIQNPEAKHLLGLLVDAATEAVNFWSEQAEPAATRTHDAATPDGSDRTALPGTAPGDAAAERNHRPSAGDGTQAAGTPGGTNWAAKRRAPKAEAVEPPMKRPAGNKRPAASSSVAAPCARDTQAGARLNYRRQSEMFCFEILYVRLAHGRKVRQQLKDYGYKAGRISQLIKLTRPAGDDAADDGPLQIVRTQLKQEGFDARDIAKLIAQTRPAALAQDPANFLEELETALDAMEADAEEAVPLTEEEQIQEVLAEWEFEESRGMVEMPQVLQPDVLPSPRNKDLEEQAEAEEEAQGDVAAGDEDAAAEEEEAAEPKAKRRRGTTELCPGLSREDPCIFSRRSDQLGTPAMLHPGNQKCQFCNPEALTAAVAVPQKKKHVTRALRVWTDAGRQDVVDAAMARIPEAHREGFRQALKRPSRAAPAVAARAAAQAQAHEEEWAKAMEQRQWLGGPFQDQEQQVYQRKTRDDARRAGTGYPTVAHADIPEVLREITDDAIRALRPLEPDVGTPVWAKHGNRVKTDMIRFWWRHIPVTEQFRQLEKEEDRAAALAAYQFLMSSSESSYKKFVDMHNKFLRRNRDNLDDPWDRKLQLPRRALEEEGLECAAWPHLYPRTAMCETYIRLQDSRRQDRAAAQARAQPSQLAPLVADSSESSGSNSSSTSSSTSSSSFGSPRAKAKREEPAMEAAAAVPTEAAAENPPEEEDSDSDSDRAEDADDDSDEAEGVAPLDFSRPGRNSAKSAYLAKVLGPVLGYGATYELFQFVYDLWLWTAVGAKKNTVEAPMRLAMGGYSFAPEYWQTRHAALVDVVKQLGYPTLFITVAPYEWSFPFHRWVEDEAKKLLRAKLHLPMAETETLHIAHVLAQTVQGLLIGANKQTQTGQNTKAWRSHVLAAKDGSGRQTVLNFFGRLEYQDGKRKRYVNQQEAATQFYHDRGTVHLHLLVWLQHVDAVRLEDSVSATVPADNDVMASLVEGSQRSWTGSGWPKEAGPSHYDAQQGVLHLHHSDEDFSKYKPDGTAEGIRAYLIDILSRLGCHVDVQMSDGRGMLLKDVSGYVPKFSDSFTTDWLCDAGSDYAVAKRVVTDFHPLAPEMTCQLSMQWFPQCFAGSTLQRFVVPVPWIGDLPARIAKYMRSAWRAPDMTLAEFLRKTNKDGAIHQKLRRRYEQAKKAAETNEEELLEESLEAWANNAPSQGEVAVAAIYLLRYNDRYYGQWVLMNVPFQDPERDLKRPELDLVPDHLYYQTLAYLTSGIRLTWLKG